MTSSPASPRIATGTASHGAKVTYPDSRNDQVTTKTPARVRRARPARVVSPARAAPARA